MELATRIMDLLKKWTKECKDTSEVLVACSNGTATTNSAHGSANMGERT